MYLAGGQLFSGPNLRDFLAERQSEATRAINALAPADFTARSPAALESSLVSRFRMPEAELLVDDSYFVAERELSVAEAGLPSAGLAENTGSAYPADTVLKSVTIAIPFRGHPALFTHRPNVFSARQPEADVIGEELHVGFIVALEEEWMIQHRFQQHIALIERTLEVTQWQAMEFNTQLIDHVRERLRARRAAVGHPL